MAKVKSPMKLSGSIGDLVYYENEFGQQVRSKGEPSEWHVQHAESYENARRNAAEWQQATNGSQLLRFAIGELYKGVKNPYLCGRMNGAVLRVVKSDPLPGWGERRASGGNLSLLKGFEFNQKLELDDALPLNVENCYTIDEHKVCLQVPAFRIRKKKSIPAKATHYRVVSALITVDFDGETHQRDLQKSPLYAMGRKAGAAFTAEHTLAPGTTGQFWLVGVEFFASGEPGQQPLQGGALRVIQYVKPVQEDVVAGKEERMEVVDDRVPEEKEVVDDRANMMAAEVKVSAKDAVVAGVLATGPFGEPVKEPVVQDHGVGGQPPVQVRYAVSQPANQAVASQVVQSGWFGVSSTVTTFKGYAVSYSVSS